MSPTQRAMFFTVVLAVIVIGGLLSSRAAAQGVPPVEEPATSPAAVTVTSPDGGMATLQVEGRGGGPILSEVTGPGAGPVDVSGSSNLSFTNATINAMREPIPCTVSPTSGFNVPVNTLKVAALYQLDGGAYTGFPRYNSLQIVNVDEKERLRCGVEVPDAGTTPSCAIGTWWGNTVFAGGGSITYSVSEAYVVRCIACGGAVDMEVTLALCVP